MNDFEIIKTETAALSLVDSVIRDAYEKSCSGDWSAIGDVSIFGRLGYFWLDQVAKETILLNLQKYYEKSESDVYEWFKDNYKDILGESFEIIKRKSDHGNRPDFWLLHGDKYIPVECKLHEFTRKGLQQLMRYMTFYGASNGVAVASELKCELPQNIRFIQHEV